MASVPELQGARVAAGGAQQPLQSIRGNAAPILGAVGEGLGAVAKTTDQAAELLNQHAVVLAGLDNKAKSDDAAVAANTALNDIVTKYTTQEQGAKALPALPAYIAEMGKARETARATLTSPMAQSMFDGQTRQVIGSLTSSMNRFAAGQQREYVEKSSVSREANAADLMSLHPADPGLEADYLKVSENETRFRALNAGLDTGEDTTNTDRMLRENRGKVFGSVALNIAATDPAGAQDYLTAREHLMDPQTYAAAQMRLKPAVMANDAALDAQGAVGEVLGTVHTEAPKDVTANPKAFFSNLAGGDVTITSGERSAAHNAAVGGVPTSEHIPGNGVAFDMTPAKGQTTAQLAAKLRASGLNAHQILDEGDHVHVGWKGGASVDSASGGNPTSAQLAAGMETAVAKAGAKAEARYPGNAVYRNTVEAQAAAFLNRRISSARDVESSATVELLNSVEAGNIEDQRSLFASNPNALRAYNALPPAGRAAVDSSMRRNANEFTLAKQQALTTYNGLWANRNNNPQAFLEADVNAMDLRPADRITALKQQQSFRAQPTAMVDKPFNAIVHSPEFKSVLGTLGIVPTAKGLQTPEYSHLLGAVSAELDAYRAKNPTSPPDEKAMAGIIARATAVQGSYRNTFLGIPYGAPQVAKEGDLDHPTRAFDVSDADRKGAVAYLQSQGLPVDEMSVAKIVHDARSSK